MRESEFEDRVIELAKLKGWHVHAERPARTATGWRTPIKGHTGFPDLVMVRDRLIFAELKSDEGRVSKEQKAWHTLLWDVVEAIEKIQASRLEAPLVEMYLWRPDSWDAIVRILT